MRIEELTRLKAVEARATVLEADAYVTFAKIQNITADTFIGRASGTGVSSLFPCTAAGRALLDDATAAAQRTTLGSTTVGDAVFIAASEAAARAAIGAGTGNGTVTSVTGTAPIVSSGGATPAISLSVTLDSGVYSPTAVNVANLDATPSLSECQYLRVGSTVTVSGIATVNPTAPATLTQLGIPLPIASNIGAAEDCAGVAFASGIAGLGAAIIGDAANNRAEMDWISGDVTNQTMSFTFTYQVI